MAMSLMLSTDYYDKSRDYRLTSADLERAAETIKSGGALKWDEATLKELIGEQILLKREGSPPWWKVIILILVMLLIPIIGVILIVLRWLNSK